MNIEVHIFGWGRWCHDTEGIPLLKKVLLVRDVDMLFGSWTYIWIFLLLNDHKVFLHSMVIAKIAFIYLAWMKNIPCSRISSRCCLLRGRSMTICTMEIWRRISQIQAYVLIDGMMWRMLTTRRVFFSMGQVLTSVGVAHFHTLGVW